MARGSSYGEKPPEYPLPDIPNTHIPRRTTRMLPAVTMDDNEAHEVEEPETELPSVNYRRVPTPASSVVSYTFEQPHPLERHRRWLILLLICMCCVVIGAFVLISAGAFQRAGAPQYVNYSGQSFPIQLGGSYDAFNRWENSNGPIAVKTPLPVQKGPYAVLGKPTITADFINQVLASYNSPAAGKGQDMYNLGVKYGIDPVYALAFFMHESLFGTTGEARVTLSLGNLRCIPTRPCIDQDRGGYAQMYSWVDGFEQWFKLIRNLYIAQWGRVTVDQIIPKYAPAADHNDEKAYIASLKHEIDTWRAGTLRP